MAGSLNGMRFFPEVLVNATKKTLSSVPKTLGSVKTSLASKPKRHESAAPVSKISSMANRASYVDMGSNGGDCGFRSVAAGLIDTLLTKPNPELLNKVLKVYGEHFERPSDKNKRFLRQPELEFEDLIDSPKKLGQFIVDLSYALRQVAADEIWAFSESYPGAFIADKNERPAIENMRDERAWIDESAIAALAKVFNQKIEVVAMEGEKTILTPVTYGPKSGDALRIKLESKHYVPMVNQVERFQQAQDFCKTKYSALHHHVADREPDPDLAEAMVKIEAINEELNRTFEANLRRLEKALETGALDQEALLSAYIKGLGHSDYLQGYQGFYDVGPGHHETQHGTAAFFASIRKNQDLHQGLDSLRAGHESILTQELVHAVARCLTIDHMQEEDVFGLSEERMGMRL